VIPCVQYLTTLPSRSLIVLATAFIGSNCVWITLRYHSLKNLIAVDANDRETNSLGFPRSPGMAGRVISLGEFTR
jgi:hypothetical protein